MKGTTHRLGSKARGQRRDQGYALLTMMLFLTMLLIAAAAAAPKIAFQVKRDREEELIHRGVEYSRAIRRFTKRTGRFPTRLEELQDTNGLRFIRKLYKDPITGGDFQLLHLSDIRPAAGVTNLNGGHARAGAAEGAGGSSGTDAASASDSERDPANADRPASGNSGNNNVNSGPQVIFGVASTSKASSIREFNHKNHYNQWLFFYDPALDRGYPIEGPTTPFVPTVPGAQPSSEGSNPSETAGTQPQQL